MLKIEKKYAVLNEDMLLGRGSQDLLANLEKSIAFAEVQAFISCKKYKHQSMEEELSELRGELERIEINDALSGIAAIHLAKKALILASMLGWKAIGCEAETLLT